VLIIRPIGPSRSSLVPSMVAISNTVRDTGVQSIMADNDKHVATMADTDERPQDSAKAKADAIALAEQAEAEAAEAEALAACGARTRSGHQIAACCASRRRARGPGNHHQSYRSRRSQR